MTAESPRTEEGVEQSVQKKHDPIPKGTDVEMPVVL